MRKAIEKFANKMEKVMQKHDNEKQDSWEYCKIEFLENKLIEECNEWADTRDTDELIDIANMCMMLYNRHHI